VADEGNGRIQKFTPDGTYIESWSVSPVAGPYHVTTDAHDNVYTTSFGTYEVLTFSPTGVLLARWGSRGFQDGQFRYPTGIAVDQSGNVFVAEHPTFRGEINRIQKFGQVPTPTLRTSWGQLKARFR
jgi:DNA-binding beta-propeller fold protein YncE